MAEPKPCFEPSPLSLEAATTTTTTDETTTTAAALAKAAATTTSSSHDNGRKERRHNYRSDATITFMLKANIPRKRKRDKVPTQDGDNPNNTLPQTVLHADPDAAAADNFYTRVRREKATRHASRIYHLRNFNNWVKATQIHQVNPQTMHDGPLRVLDLACGKGGDLKKWAWHRRGLANYVGIDAARGSLCEAAERARRLTRKRLPQCTLTCADLGQDVPGRHDMPPLLTWSLDDDYHSSGLRQRPMFRPLPGGGMSPTDRFDVISIQFAIHYMMKTKERARRFFLTASQLLEVGGNLLVTTMDARVVLSHALNLGLDLHEDSSQLALLEEAKEPVVISVGDACEIRFEPQIVRAMFQQSESSSARDILSDDFFGLRYSFLLVDDANQAAVNLPEYLTPLPVLEALAAEVGLVVDYAQNFHTFYASRNDPVSHPAAHQHLKNMKVMNREGTMSQSEWDTSHLYLALQFRKVHEME